MKYFLVALISLGLSSALADDHDHHDHDHKDGKHSHREHGAHLHGQAHLMIAFDGTQGKVEFESPAVSIMGFEHEAKKDADVKAKKDAITKMEANIAAMVGLAPELKCVFSKESIEQKFENSKKKNHSEFVAIFNVKCEKSPVGSSLNIDISKHFPKVEKTEVVVVADSVQKSISVKGPFQIELK